jgi:hypothetical protein
MKIMASVVHCEQMLLSLAALLLQTAKNKISISFVQLVLVFFKL